MKRSIGFTMKKLFVMTLIGSLFVSCAKEQPLTKTKISLNHAATAALYPGGVFVSGKNLDTNLLFSKRIIGSEHELDLPSGRWAFRAHGWKGAANMDGDLHCYNSSVVELGSDDVSIDVAMSKDGCSSAFFSKPNYSQTIAENGTSFVYPKSIQVVSCEGDDKPEQNTLIATRNVESNDLCDKGKGVHRSFKITYFDNAPVAEQELDKTKTNPFSSKCVTLNQGNYNSAGELIVPALSYFPVEVSTYYSQNCDESKNKTVLHFPHGLHNAVSTGLNGFVKEGEPTVNKIFTVSQVCSSGYEKLSLNTILANSSVYGVLGTENNPYMICSASQFNDIGSTEFTNQYFELKRDITFAPGESANVKAAPFTGSIEGKNFTVHNLNINESAGNFGLFSQISSNDNYIRNINFRNINLVNTDPAASYTGLLTGKLWLAAGSQKIEFDNINVTNDSPLLPGITSSAGSLGGLFGTIYANAVTNRSQIRNIFFNATLSSTCTTSCQNIGGFAGYTQNFTGNEMDFNNIKIESDILSSANKVGGIIGYASKLSLFDVSFRGKIEGNDQVGGIIGFGQDVQINKGFTDFQYIRKALANSKEVGGIVGMLKYQSTEKVHISHCSSNIRINQTDTFKTSNLGGLIGFLTNDASPEASSGASIMLNKAHIDATVDSDKAGGLVGYLHKNTANGTVIFDENLVTGKIIRKTNGHGNFLGGFVGKSDIPAGAAHTFKVMKGISQLDLHGHTYIGGIVGMNVNSEFNNLFYDGDLTADNNQIAGVVAKNQEHGVFRNISVKGKIKINTSSIEIAKVTVNNYLNGVTPAGRSFDLIDTARLISFDSSNLVSSINDATSFCPLYCQTMAWDGTPDPAKHIVTVNTLAPNGGFSGATQWQKLTSVMHLSFVLENFQSSGSIAASAGQKDKFNVGNWLDPFPIKTIADWNAIGTNMSKLNKSYRLESDLDFLNTSANFVPIGSYAFPFTGILIPNGKTLSNILITPLTSGNTQAAGVVSAIGEASGQIGVVGLHDDPLFIKNIEIDGGSGGSINNVGAAVGRAAHGSVSAHITGANIHSFGAGSTSIGGVVGQLQHGKITNSLFDGKINTEFAVNVGGILGAQSLDAQATPRSNIEVRHCSVKSSLIYGSSQIGGLIGKIETSTSNAEARISNNRVTMILDSTTAGEVKSSQSVTNASYFINAPGFGSANIELRRNLVDLKNGVTDDGRGKFFTSAASSPLGDKNYLVGKSNIPTSSLHGASSSASLETDLTDFRPEEYGSL